MNRREFITLLGSTAAAWPLAARAQQPARPVIGYLAAGTLDVAIPFLPAFHAGLKENGYVEGRNVATEFRWAEGRHDRLPALAAELISLKVAVLVAPSAPAAVAARQATQTIPIAFFSAADPVEHGLVASLGRPGGNATGVFNYSADLMPKRLELLRELLPHVRSVAFLVNPGHPTAASQLRDVQAAAQLLGVDLWVLEARTADDIQGALNNLADRRPHTLLVAADVFFVNQRALIVALAARNALPAIYDWSEFAAAGGLISYGVNLRAALRLLGTYTARSSRAPNRPTFRCSSQPISSWSSTSRPRICWASSSRPPSLPALTR